VRPFAHVTVAGLDDALAEAAAGARPIAGGTDLLTVLKAGLDAPETLVDLKGVAELAGIGESDGYLVLGANTTLAEIARPGALPGWAGALRDSAAEAATPALRNMARLGGNLLQSSRCWYYRDGFSCWLAGGQGCPATDGRNEHLAVTGGGPCHSVHPSDPATALAALGAEVEVAGRGGSRAWRALQDVVTPPGEQRRRHHALGPGELITRVRLPVPPTGTASVYLKAMDRAVFSFALVGVAAAATVQGRRLTEVRLYAGAVAPAPLRLEAAESVVEGKELTPELAAEAASRVLVGAPALSDNGYKVPLTRALVRRALLRLAGEETPRA
jgi:xanthine dehydrogenase YagS FAD-binding subunit